MPKGYFGIFLFLSLLVLPVFALIILSLLFPFFCVFPFLVFALRILHFLFVFFLDKLNFTIQFFFLLLRRSFSFVNDWRAKPAIFQMPRTDVKVVLAINQLGALPSRQSYLVIRGDQHARSRLIADIAWLGRSFCDFP